MIAVDRNLKIICEGREGKKSYALDVLEFDTKGTLEKIRDGETWGDLHRLDVKNKCS